MSGISPVSSNPWWGSDDCIKAEQSSISSQIGADNRYHQEAQKSRDEINNISSQ